MATNTSDIFKSARIPGDAWKIDGAVLTFDTSGGAKSAAPNVDAAGNKQLIAVGVDFTYQRQVSPITPINLDETYLIAGQPTGTLNIRSLIGPNTDLKAFLDAYADICNPPLSKKTMTLNPAGMQGCSSSGGVSAANKGFVMKGVLLTSIGISVQELGQGNMAVAGNLTLMVLAADWTT